MLTATLADAGPGPVFVFPGQGSQYPGMGRELTACGASARDLVDQAERVTGLDLTALMSTASTATIADPELAQLLVFVSSSVLLAELRAHGVTPAAVAGHSLGEYTALVACGALNWHTALGLVACRGKAMAEAARRRPGAMGAVVGLPLAEVERICQTVQPAAGVLVVANVNSARQTVISGGEDEVQAALDAAREAGALRARRIPVGGAYHSPLMAPAQRELAPVLRRAPLATPHTPFVSSVTGEQVTDIEAYRAELLEQITRPVRWHSVIGQFADAGVAQFVEVGPGRVLAGLSRETARGVRCLGALEALRGRGRRTALARSQERGT